MFTRADERLEPTVTRADDSTTQVQLCRQKTAAGRNPAVSCFTTSGRTLN